MHNTLIKAAFFMASNDCTMGQKLNILARKKNHGSKLYQKKRNGNIKKLASHSEKYADLLWKSSLDGFPYCEMKSLISPKILDK